MGERKLKELAADIKDNGLLEEITLHEGQILDGRNRIRACAKVGVKPRFVNFDNHISPLNYVISKNLQRRQLTPSQGAVAAHKTKSVFKEEGKRHQATSTGGAHPQLQAARPKADKWESREEVAKIFGVGGRTVSKVGLIAREAPEAIQRIESGESTVEVEYRKLRPRKRPRHPEDPPQARKKWRPRELAAEKRRMETAISGIQGFSDALGTLNIAKILAACDRGEALDWVSLIAGINRGLRRFGDGLKKGLNDE